MFLSSPLLLFFPLFQSSVAADMKMNACSSCVCVCVCTCVTHTFHQPSHFRMLLPPPAKVCSGLERPDNMEKSLSVAQNSRKIFSHIQHNSFPKKFFLLTISRIFIEWNSSQEHIFFLFSSRSHLFSRVCSLLTLTGEKALVVAKAKH